MPSLSELKELGPTYASSLQTNFSTYLLELGQISHLRPHASTQNLIYFYGQDKKPVLAKTVIVSDASHTLSSGATFPPLDIDTCELLVSLGSRVKPKSGDIFLWMAGSGNILGCWVLKVPRSPPRSPQRISWARINVRKANMRHPLDENFRLEVKTEGIVGWVPVQTFAANALVRDPPPPPAFENLGKINDPNLGPVYVFLIRHEDSDETNLCYISSGAADNFQIGFTDPSATTRPGDIFIDLQSSCITPTSLIGRSLWILLEGYTWSNIQGSNLEYQTTRHPIDRDYLFKAPNLEYPYPQWIFKPEGATADVQTKKSPTGIADTNLPIENVIPPELHISPRGQKRSAPETREPDGERRKIATRRFRFMAESSKDSVERDRCGNSSLSTPNGESSTEKTNANTDSPRVKPSALQGGIVISTSASTLSTVAALTRRLDKRRKANETQKRREETLQTSLRETQALLQEYQRKKQEADVLRKADISVLAQKLQVKCRELRCLDGEAQAMRLRVQQTDKALDDEKEARIQVDTQVAQLQKSSYEDQRQIALLQDRHSEAEAQLSSAKEELSGTRAEMERLRRENQAALAEVVNNLVVSDARGHQLETAMNELLREKRQEHEQMDQRYGDLEIELQRAKSEAKRSMNAGQNAVNRADNLEKACANHEQNTRVLDDNLSRAREEISRLRHDIKSRDDVITGEATSREESEARHQQLQAAFQSFLDHSKTGLAEIAGELRSRECSEREMQSTLSDFRAAAVEYFKEVSALNEERDTLRSELAAKQSDLKVVVGEREKIILDRARLEKQVSSMESVLKKVRGEKAKATAESEEYASILKGVILGLRGQISHSDAFPGEHAFPHPSAKNDLGVELPRDTQPLGCDSIRPDGLINIREECPRLMADLSSWKARSITSLSSTKFFLAQERKHFTAALSKIQDELEIEQVKRRKLENALEAIRRECCAPFTIPRLMDLFLEMYKQANDVGDCTL